MATYSSGTHLRPKYFAVPPGVTARRTSFDGLGTSYVKRPTTGKPVSRRANSGSSVVLPITTGYSTPFTSSVTQKSARPRSASFDRTPRKAYTSSLVDVSIFCNFGSCNGACHSRSMTHTLEWTEVIFAGSRLTLKTYSHFLVTA